MARRRGVQEPSFALVPKHAQSEGGEACALAAGYDMKPDKWQRIVLEGWLATDSKLQWAASDCGCAVPRQNGKNAILEFTELYLAAILGMKILHTAHEVKTCRKHFLRMKYYFENARKFPELAELVTYIRATNGQEAIVLKNGGSIEFIARSKSSGRGFTVDVLVCDEAQELTDEQMEAYSRHLVGTLGQPVDHLHGHADPADLAGHGVRAHAPQRASRQAAEEPVLVRMGGDRDRRRARPATLVPIQSIARHPPVEKRGRFRVGEDDAGRFRPRTSRLVERSGRRAVRYRC